MLRNLLLQQWIYCKISIGYIKEAFRIGSLVYEQYDQREQCSTFFSKQEELSGCRDYYLSDTIVLLLSRG